jgi:hypothetical protein
MAGFARPTRHKDPLDRRLAVRIHNFKRDPIDREARLGALDKLVPFHRQAESIVHLVANAKDHRIHINHAFYASPFCLGVAIHRDEFGLLDLQPVTLLRHRQDSHRDGQEFEAAQIRYRFLCFLQR